MTALGAAERRSSCFGKALAAGTSPGAAPGKQREAGQPSPAKAEGAAYAAGQLLFPCLTMANLLVTSQFWEQNIIL